MERIDRTFRAFWLGLKGRVRFARGRRDGSFNDALATFQQLVELEPDSFVGHYYLGLIAADDLLYKVALREFTICYRLNPNRFRRAQLPPDLKDRVLRREEFDGDEALGAPRLRESLWSHRHANTTSAAAAAEAATPEAAWGLDEMANDELERSDFSSYGEYRRFQSLPPITPEEIDETDVDAVLERLFREE